MRRPLPPLLRTPLHALGAAAICVAAFGLPAIMAGGVGLAVPTTSFESPGERPFAGFEAEPMVLSLDALPELPDPDPGAHLAHRPTRVEGRPPAPKPPPPPPRPAEPAEPEVVSTPAETQAVASTDPPVADPGEVRQSLSDLRRQSMSRARRGLHPDPEVRRTVRHRPPPCRDAVEGIDDLGDGHYRVARSVLDHYTRLNEALKLAAVSWHRDENGKIDGFSVYRIRCGNPLAQVGLRNGDVIHTINGKRVRSIPHAIVVVAKVKRKDRIHVIGSRRGERLDIVAEVI